ncbi:MAG: right-handed parallel beta-helix repeat-containing protein [candidate division KSB1 bacterium]|nr:right-handed parallel beta-helix repeat-containing protein [candidate division KSB1 bacterium]
MGARRELTFLGVWSLPFTLLTLGALSSGYSLAQPTGGPYGPLPQTYRIPPLKGRVYYVAPDGKAEAAGDAVSCPTTLESAISRARTGDAIILRGGTYRTGNQVFNQGILIQPYLDEQPVLKGTYVATEWQNLGNGLWVTTWPHLFPSRPASWWNRNREGKVTPLHRFNNDMVFVDGKFLQSAGWEGEVDQSTYYIDYDAGKVYIGVDPAKHLVEITAFDAAFIRTTKEVNGKKADRVGPIIRGLTITQYAYRAIEIEGTEGEGPTPESNFGKDVVGTTIEHCTISYCSRVAGYLRGDRLTVRHCRVSDTSTEGLYIISSNDVLLEKNIFTRNNIERISGYYPAAVKIFNQCHRVTCRDNLVIDHPYSNGIWYDVGNVDGRFLDNWVQDVGRGGEGFVINPPWRNEAGFFFEISKGAVCARNVFVNCKLGVHVLNSADVTIVNNTFVDSPVCIARTERSATNDAFGWHASTGPDVHERVGHVVVNNLMHAGRSAAPLLCVWQSPALCNTITSPQCRVLDHNVYVVGANRWDNVFIIFTSEEKEGCHAVYPSLSDFRRAHGQYESHGRSFADRDGGPFKSAELGNYQLLRSFPGASSGCRWETGAGVFGPYVGAYGPRE